MLSSTLPLLTRFHLLILIGFIYATSTGRAQAQQPARTEIANAAQPQLAVSADGRVWLAYGHGTDIFVAGSDDGAVTFQNAIKVASVPKLMLGMRRGPRIVAHGDELVLTVVAHELLAYRSTDAGRSWTGPVTINDVALSAREGLHDLAISPQGSAMVTWLDLRNGKMELWGASSQDVGRTWSKNEQIYKSPDKSICECCHPTALFDAGGNLAIMWRNSIEGSRDMWMTTRTKGAQNFSAARKLGEGTWKLNACPMDGGEIIAFSGGKFGAVWQRNGEVFVTLGDGPEVSLGPGRQPVSVTGGGQPLVVWQQGTNLVTVRDLSGTEPVKQAAEARFASLAALPGGNGRVLAYERVKAKGATTVVVERL